MTGEVMLITVIVRCRDILANTDCVVQIYPRVKYVNLFLCLVMYDNEFKTN